MPGPSPSARRIIVNADDLGLCASVNTAIFEVFRAGNLNSATLMVNMPGAKDAVDRLQQHPGLAVGLHFCITEGEALTGPSLLTDADGRFLDRATIAKRTLRGNGATDLRKEFEAQLEGARQMGVNPSHCDSHQHVMMLPAVFDAVLPVLHRDRLPVRLVDPPRGSVTTALNRPRKAMKQWLNQRFAARNRTRSHVPMNDSLVSVHDLDSVGPYDGATYARLLERAPVSDVVEVMVHPYLLGADVTGLYGDRLAAKMPFLQRCEAEYHALRGSPVFSEASMINYAQL